MDRVGFKASVRSPLLNIDIRYSKKGHARICPKISKTVRFTSNSLSPNQIKPNID